MVNEDELRALASKWKQTAIEQVPAEYADRGLHGKYLKLDNYAAGLDDCAIELLELLDPRSPTLREADGGAYTCPSCENGLCPDGKGGFIPCTICGRKAGHV